MPAVKHLYTLEDFGDAEIEAVLEDAASFKRGRTASVGPRKTACFVFLNPSLRTRVSMETACHRLGLNCVSLYPGSDSWKLEWRDGIEMSADAQEHIEEAASVLSRYVQVLGVRSFPGGKDLEEDQADPVLRGFVKYSGVPVINLESALYHPMQALADWMTMRELAGNLKGRKIALTWTYHPKAVPMAVSHSFLLAAARTGCDLALAHPPGYELLPGIIQNVESLSKAHNGTFAMTNSQDEALDGASIVYVKSWGSVRNYGNPEEEGRLREPHRSWKMTLEKLRRTKSAKVMHCLPLRRNVEIDEEVLHSPHSAVLQEAENRLWTSMAVLNRLVSV